MDRVYRKLQNLGGSYFVSLPKNWVENYEMKSKSSVAIDIRSDGSLSITPKMKQTDESLKDELVLQSSPFVIWELLRKSLSGQMNIVVVSDKEISTGLRNDIRYFVNGLPNTEITEESKQRMTIQNFGYKKIPTKKLIKRLLYLIANMFEDVKEQKTEDVKYSFKQLRKFYFILVIHIRTYLRTGIYVTEDNDFTPLEAMDYRMFCEKIQEIGKILKDLNLNENVIDFFGDISQYFNEVMEGFFKKDDKLAYYAWLKKDKLVDKATTLIEGLDYEDKDKIKDMLRIAHRCKDMAALI
jgi:phosphate uptake regulator